MNDSNAPVPYGDYQVLGPQENESGAPPSLGARRFLAFLLRYWWIPTVTSLVGAGAAVCYLIWVPPTFVSSAKMYEPEKLRLPGGTEFTEDVQNFLGTQTELLKSSPLRENTLKVLSESWTNGLPQGKDGLPLPVSVLVSMPAKSSVFTIQATSSNPGYTHDYLDALVQEYLSYKQKARRVVSGGTLDSITKELKNTETELKEAQDKLNDFGRTNDLAVLDEREKMAGSFLQKLDTDLTQTRLDLQILSAAEAEKAAKDAGTNRAADSASQSIANPPPGVASAANSSAQGQNAATTLALLQLKYDKWSKIWKPKHPEMEKLMEDMKRNQTILDIASNQNRRQIESRQDELNQKEKAILSQMTEWKEKVMAANDLNTQAQALQQHVARARQEYDRLSLMVENVDISRNIDQADLMTLEPASLPLRSRKQDINKAVMITFGGLALGLAIILLIALRDDRIGSLVEINERLGDNIVGQVPEVRIGGQDRRLGLLEIEDERQMYAESYRSLRSALLFMATGGDRPKVLLVTSALPDEGKSTITANLARAMALGGSRVLVIDGDLRKGTLHELMGGPREPGLTELLRQPDNLDKIIRSDSVPNLSFIPCGGTLSNPGDLFLDPSLDQLLARLRLQFDYVIIDSSPVFAADDAATLAPKVDGTLFVVRSRFSRVAVVREALDLLYQRQAKVLGLIFNRADSSARSYYYYKHSSYYYHRPAKAG